MVTKKTGPTGPNDKKETKAEPKSKTKAVETKAAESQAKKETKAKKPAAPAVKRAPLIPQGTSYVKKGASGRGWKIVDVSGQTLGRISSQIAVLLMGKHQPFYTPNNDTGESVVVINAAKVRLSGDKWNQKLYQHHTGFPGGLKTFTAKEILAKAPEQLVEKAVWRMLPKSRGHMARRWFSKLHVYAGDTHPHQAQKPEPIKLRTNSYSGAGE